MSKVQVDKVVNLSDDGAPQLTYGAELPVGYGLTGAGGLNISGVVTAASAVFSGNVTIGGTLTYEDVTNIDVVGVSTFAGRMNVNSSLLANEGIKVVGVSTLSTTNTGVLSVIKAASGGATANSDAALIVDNSSHTYVQFRTPATKEQGLLFGDDADNNVGSITYSHSTNALSFAANASERLNINSTGKVRVGSGSATYNLEVQNAGFVETMIGSTDASGAGIILDGDSNGDGSGGDYAQIFHQNDGTLNFRARNGSGGTDTTFLSNTTETLRIDSSGRLLIGHSSNLHDYQLQVLGADGNASLALSRFTNNSASSLLEFNKSRNGSVGSNTVVQDGDTVGVIRFKGADGTDYAQVADIQSQIDGTPGNNDMPGRLIFGTTADGAQYTTERLRITSAGDMGLGCTPDSGVRLHIEKDGEANMILEGDVNGIGGYLMLKNNNTTANTSMAIQFIDGGGQGTSEIKGINADNSNNEGHLAFSTRPSGGSMTERARFDSSGRLLIGTTSGTSTLTVSGDIATSGDLKLTVDDEKIHLGAGGDFLLFHNGSNNYVYGVNDHPTLFHTNNIQRMSIESNGDYLFKKTSADQQATGVQFEDHGLAMFTKDNIIAYFTRTSSDGQMIRFYGDTTSEGSINISGSSISYNGGVLTRWSQLVGISTNVKSDRPTIYQGTVMSNLDEMADWGDEENMQLNKTQVSTASGDKNVAGVFWAWDDDDDVYTNDFYVAQTGDFIVRVGAATTITRGDLLESAGDGTAKPQSDDIVRSKTVAKVTSGIAHTTYADGSKVYPCVLMAC